MAYYPLNYPATIPDKWHIIVIDKDVNELGTFECSLEYEAADETHFDVKPGTYSRSGAIDLIKIYKNGNLYAKLPSNAYRAVLINQSEQGGALYVPLINRVIMKSAPVCTCGGWAVYGKEADLHADNLVNTCDLRKK